MLGVNLSLPRIAAASRPYSPLALFAANEPGVFFDFSDTSTMYQDAAGTTPVTGVEQAVGLVLDKSRGLTPGSNIVVNGGFDSDTGWSKTGATIAGGVADLPALGGTIQQAFSGTAGRSYKVSVTVGTNGSGQGVWYLAVGGAATSYSGATGTFNYILTAVSTGNITISHLGGASGSFTFDNISVREIPGTHALQSTPTARPILRKDTDGSYYLAFDGTDDGLLTSSIDFTGTDKMSVIAGVRKLRDTGFGIIAEISASSGANAGSFYLDGPESGTNFGFYSRGSVAPSAPALATGFTSPVSAVITGLGDISGDKATIRANGAQAAQSTSDQGTGNYGNHSLFIGRRNNASLPYEGRIYGLIVRGAASTAAEIASAESWMNSRVRAY